MTYSPPGLPWWFSDKESTCQCRRCVFHLCIGKIPWRRKWQPTPGFLPGESHGWWSLVGYSPQGHKGSDMTEQLHLLHSFMYWFYEDWVVFIRFFFFCPGTYISCFSFCNFWHNIFFTVLDTFILPLAIPVPVGKASHMCIRGPCGMSSVCPCGSTLLLVHVVQGPGRQVWMWPAGNTGGDWRWGGAGSLFSLRATVSLHWG